ncbi:hypothetical protein DDZ18_05820 [Marinicauda salina]|uniref:Uncharacterized protein n=1 Tax=Marinicauda salina TaxID=2135793 RepID=A0A2U2BTA4_9PROT|nr:hypothetical protein [Marinicauda salina]PWE17210.1 hypothetical protein DDZ18_05820 [Marinicauda salina]
MAWLILAAALAAQPAGESGEFEELSPAFDTEAACEAMARQYGTYLEQMYQDCLTGEARNREVVRVLLERVDDETEQACLDRFEETGRRPSYLAMRGCLESHLANGGHG